MEIFFPSGDLFEPESNQRVSADRERRGVREEGQWKEERREELSVINVGLLNRQIDDSSPEPILTLQ